MVRANRLLGLGYVMLLAAACRDAAAPGARAALPDVSAADGQARHLITYSTYLGGSGDDGGSGIAVDGAGNMYVVGYTFSTNFPTSAGAVQTSMRGSAGDAFVTKLSPTTGLIYSTYLGGSDPDNFFGDQGTAIAVDAQGNAFVTGHTYSTSFPTTPGAPQTSFGGVRDAFVAELNPAGSALVYSTYVGGAGNEGGNSIAVDAAGNAYVTGSTSSANFPTTPGAVQTILLGGSDVFVTVLNPTGSGFVYSTYLGGVSTEGGNGIAVDAAGNAYVTGSTGTGFPTTPGAVQSTPGGGGEAFVTALNAAGSGLLYSTYLGGSGGDVGNKIAVDAAGNAYVTGNTGSSNFPITATAFQTSLAGGSSDAFIAALNPTGSGLVYSTYLGGTGTDQGAGIAIDAAGNAYVAGSTASTDFPTTPGAIPGDSIVAGNDAFVTALTGTGSALVYSMRLGGRGTDGGRGIVVDTAGTAYITGSTANLGANNFPITPGAFQPLPGGFNDAFATRIAKVALPAGTDP